MESLNGIPIHVNEYFNESVAMTLTSTRLLTMSAELPSLYTVGNYFFGAHALGTLANAYALTANRQYFNYFIVPTKMTFDRIAVSVETAEADKLAYLGLYADDGTGLAAGALLIDGSTVSLASAAVVTVTINLQVSPGIIWTSVLANSSTAKIYRNSVYLAPPFGYDATLAPQGFVGYQAQAYGALPATASSQTCAVLNNPLAIGLRIASIP